MSSTTLPQATTSERPAAKRGARALAIKVLLLATSICVCLALLELAVRWLLPYYSPERQIWFHMTSNGVAMGLPNETVRQRTPKGDYDLVITYNALGFRDSRDLRQSTESDWFVVGDSFSFGWGVPQEQRYSDLLEAHLKTNGLPARVFNIAIPENIVGYQRLVAYAETNGAKVRRLIIGICMENDLVDYTNPLTASERDYQGVVKITKKEKLRWFIKQRSALYIATTYTLQRIPFVRRLFEKMGLSRNVQVLSGKAEWNPKAIETGRDELLKLVAGREALILIIPARRLWHDSERETEVRVHDAFVGSLRQAGMRVVDMRPVFDQTSDPLAHYFKTDPHWSPEGHARAAAELAKAIRDLQTRD